MEAWCETRRAREKGEGRGKRIKKELAGSEEGSVRRRKSRKSSEGERGGDNKERTGRE